MRVTWSLAQQSPVGGRLLSLWGHAMLEVPEGLRRRRPGLVGRGASLTSWEQ